MKKGKYYAYVLPRQGKQGVVSTWAECEKLVKGKDARYRGFDTRDAAEKWLESGAQYEAREKPDLRPGIYFDAGTGRGQGVEISVTDEKGKNLLHKVIPKEHLNKFGKHLLSARPGGEDFTNNYGELMAMRYALRLAGKLRIKKIFGDSRLVLDFWSKGIMKRKDLPKETVRLADEVRELRKQFESRGGDILKISGDHNPADLGFH